METLEDYFGKPEKYEIPGCPRTITFYIMKDMKPAECKIYISEKGVDFYYERVFYKVNCDIITTGNTGTYCFDEEDSYYTNPKQYTEYIFDLLVRLLEYSDIGQVIKKYYDIFSGKFMKLHLTDFMIRILLCENLNEFDKTFPKLFLNFADALHYRVKVHIMDAIKHKYVNPAYQELLK